MGSFYQNGIVANLHDFSYGKSGNDNYQKLEKELIKSFNELSDIYQNFSAMKLIIAEKSSQ